MPNTVSGVNWYFCRETLKAFTLTQVRKCCFWPFWLICNIAWELAPTSLRCTASCTQTRNRVALRQLCDELANGKAVHCSNPFFFVKRAHTDHLNEKHMAFFFIICTVSYNTNLKYPFYKRTNTTFKSDYNGYTTRYHL